MADDSNTYYLEEVLIDEEDLGKMEFDEVPEVDVEDEDDNFQAVLETLQRTNLGLGVTTEKRGDDLGPAGVKAKPTVMDDFIRNFLVKLNMLKSLETFNTEWFELKANGMLNTEDIAPVTDLYQQNERLDDQVKQMRGEVAEAYKVAEKARGTWDQFRKERDFHRMHHRRVVQEKNILIRDMKRLQKHYSTFEPALKAVKAKYEAACKERTLMKLERDRMNTKLETLKSELEDATSLTTNDATKKSKSRPLTARKERGENKDKQPAQAHKEFNAHKKSGEAVLPPDARHNPFLDKAYGQMHAEKFALRKSYAAHTLAVGAVAVHPTKAIAVTVSDDRTWKMWSTQRGDLIMSGDGHKDWLGGCSFHPAGGMLATSSGDATVKLWDFVQAKCVATLMDHTQAVWDCSFHDTGDFLVTASMDHTARVFDVASGRCRQTLRGHVDSVNRVSFQPFSNNVVTASGDKTVSLWDVRSGLCIQTFYGHSNAVLSASFSFQGDQVASGDADGIVRLWDIRTVSQIAQLNTSGGWVNDVKFDLSGQTLLAACEDGSIKVYNTRADEAFSGELRGHEGGVQSIAIDSNNDFFIGGGADGQLRVFSM